jgi:DNA-binding transcriptional LysR family regulator
LPLPTIPLARRDAVTALDLEGEPLLLTEPGGGYRNLLDRALSAAGVRPSADLELASVAAIAQCAIAGMGIAFLPRVTVAAALEQRRLVALRWESGPLVARTQMLWHGTRWRSPALEAFLAIMREVLQPPPDAATPRA